MRQLLLSLILFIMPLLISSCGSEETAAKNMKQIFNEKGIPIKAQTLQPREFATFFSYHAALTGIQESSAYASIGERVEKINSNVGDEVQKDQVIVTFPDDNSESQYNQAKVGYENALISFNRMSKLRASGGISEQEYDNVKAQYEVTKANWTAVKKMIKVTAPITGRISRINVAVSQNVKRGAELFTVSRTERLKAQIWVAEKEIQNVREGMQAHAYWNTKKLKGRVVRVDRAINNQRQAFGAQVEFDNPGEKVRSGITAEIRILTYINPKALVVEKRLLVSEGRKQYLYLTSEGKAQKTAVTTGRMQGLDIEILSGLKHDDMVVTAGHQLLAEGKKTNLIQQKK